MDLSEPNIFKVATRLRRLFTQKKRLQLPNYKLNEKFSKIQNWEKVARKVIEAGADPADWVEACFDRNTVPGGPWVPTLGGKEALRWYKAYLSTDEHGKNHKDTDDMVKYDIESLKKTLARNNQRPLDEQETLEQILMDPLNRFPAYIRVAAGPQYGAVRKKYLDEGREFVRGSEPIKNALHEAGFDTKIFNEC